MGLLSNMDMFAGHRFDVIFFFPNPDTQPGRPSALSCTKHVHTCTPRKEEGVPSEWVACRFDHMGKAPPQVPIPTVNTPFICHPVSGSSRWTLPTYLPTKHATKYTAPPPPSLHLPREPPEDDDAASSYDQLHCLTPSQPMTTTSSALRAQLLRPFSSAPETQINDPADGQIHYRQAAVAAQRGDPITNLSSVRAVDSTSSALKHDDMACACCPGCPGEGGGALDRGGHASETWPVLFVEAQHPV